MVKPKSLGEQRIQLENLLADAKHLKSDFDRGDVLAAFECCSILREAEALPEAYPDWVLDYLTSIAAEYYSKGPLVGAEAISPREFLDMNKTERSKLIPSFDKVAGLSGKLGRADNTAWERRAEHDRDPYVQSYLDGLMLRRDQGKDKVYLKFSDSKKTVPVFTEQGLNKGAFRSEALKEIARFFKVRGEEGRASAKTMRRRYRLIPTTRKMPPKQKK